MKAQKTKLTKPQEKLLREIAEHPHRTIWSGFPPLVKLVEIGFVRMKEGRLSCALFVTDAGREWLDANAE